MWAFIYIGVFLAAVGIGIASKFVQPSWTKDFTAEWNDLVGTVYKDIPYGEKDANKFDLYVPADNTKENYSIPCAHVSVIDTFLRILPVVQNVERKMVTNFSVFIIQFPYGLLGTLKEHFYDFFIINHRATSFLVSPIYYGFSRQY